MLLQALDWFFELGHGAFIALILFGWVTPVIRKLHLFAIGMITFSWFLLGYWKGWGYCFCTEAHWHIKEQLGYQNLPDSYIAYCFERYLGLSVSNSFVNWLSGGLFGFCMCLTFYVNFIAPRLAGRFKPKLRG